MRRGRRICSCGSSSGFTTKLRCPSVHMCPVEFEQQPQLTLAFAQKDVEYKTNELSEKSDAFSWVKADLDGAKRELSLTNEYFDKLKPGCMNSGTTHAEEAELTRDA